jgi:5-methylcytosine-specific restriction endonuclease McrA
MDESIASRDLICHHLIRISDGGFTTPDNLVLAHRKCHDLYHKTQSGAVADLPDEEQ